MPFPQSKISPQKVGAILRKIYPLTSVNQTRALTGIALLFTAYLSVALVHLGLDKFHYLLAGGNKFATFPNLSFQLGIGGSYLLLSILYLIWLKGCLQSPWQPSNWRFRDLCFKTSAFWLLAFVSYPLGNDTYLYLHSGLMNLSGVNPFLVRAAAFATELSAYVDWGQTSTYGPVSQVFFTLSAAFVKISPILALYVFKAVCLGLHLLNGYWIWRWLPLSDRGKITVAYLLHPLLLMEQVSSAHVDVLVSTSVILLALGLAKQHFWGTLMALWAGFLSKTLPIIWVPLVVVALLRQGRWKWLFGMIAVSGAIVAGLWFTVMPELSAWKSLFNPGVTGQYQSSLHAIARFGLDLVRIFAPEHMTLLQQRSLLNWFTSTTLLAFFGFYGWRLWRSDRYWIPPTPQLVVEEMGWVTLFLMLVATPWLMPWYASVMITFAALVPQARLLGLTSLAFGLSSSAQYLLNGNSSLKSLVSIGLPVLTLIIGAWLLRSQPKSPSNGSAASFSSIKLSSLE